jgi:steroid delta-isomerase-like uncharacterized protein
MLLGLYPRRYSVTHNNKHPPLQGSQPPGFRTNEAGGTAPDPGGWHHAWGG